MKIYQIFVLIIGLKITLNGQLATDSTNISNNKSQEIIGESSIKKINFSGYAETYYQFENLFPRSNTRPAFVYSHNRNNEVNLNLAFIKANYETQKERVN